MMNAQDINLDQFAALYDRAQHHEEIPTTHASWTVHRFIDQDDNEIVVVDGGMVENYILISTRPVRFDLNLPDLDLTGHL